MSEWTVKARETPKSQTYPLALPWGLYRDGLFVGGYITEALALSVKKGMDRVEEMGDA